MAVVSEAMKGTPGSLAAAVSKHRSGGSGVRKDLLGFCDVLVLGGKQHGLIAVQATVREKVSSRCAKIATECGADALEWLRSGGRILVMGWSKEGSRWQARTMEITEREGKLVATLAENVP